MKKHYGKMLCIISILLSVGGIGLWVHIQRQHYARNRHLIAALERGDAKTALALVNAGADPNTPFARPPTPSLFALIQHWLHQEAPPTEESPTAFLLACGLGWDTVAQQESDTLPPLRLGNEPLILAMIAHDADVNTPTQEEATVLSIAVSLNRTQLVEQLLSHGADANTTDEHGLSPLMWAAIYDNLDMVRSLLEHGAQVNQQERAGWTSLHYAVRYSTNKDIVAQLLLHRANPAIYDKTGITPLNLAQKQRRSDITGLLKYGK